MIFSKRFAIPNFVTADRVADWEQQQPTPPKFSLVRVLRHEAANSCDWLRLYCLRHVATQGYTHPCVLRYDLAGGTEFYATPAHGCRAAIAAERKARDTEKELPASAAKVFTEIVSYCQKVEESKITALFAIPDLPTKGTAPDGITPQKVLDFEAVTPLREGITSITFMAEEATRRKANWPLFYCWCHVRTKGFRDPCMARRDVGNSGKTYETFRDGAKDAVLAFISNPTIVQMDEGPAVEQLYRDLVEFCAGAVYDAPQQDPEAPEGKPSEKPVPLPPMPVEQVPKSKKNWLKIAIPLALAGAGIVAYFLPEPFRTLVKTILSSLGV